MMFYFIFSFIFFPFTVFNNNPFPDFDVHKGLIAYYSFDFCDARDETGNGSDGTMYGSVECWCGVKDDGLLFDGVNDYLKFEGPVNRYFTTSDFTVSFYFKSTSFSPLKQSLLSKRAACDEIQMFDIILDESRKIIETEVHENEQVDYPGLSPATDSSAWQHFVLVREGTRAFTYINGILQMKSRRCSGVDISNGELLSFSDSPCIGSGVRKFRGVLDELRVYDYALSESEVKHLYSQNPVELAEQDCFSFNEKKLPFPLMEGDERNYLCHSFLRKE